MILCFHYLKLARCKPKAHNLFNTELSTPSSSTNGLRTSDNREMHSHPHLSSAHQQTTNKIEDIFLIHDRSTHRPIENDDLDFLAKTVLSAAKDPLNSHSLRAQVDELQLENYMLADRIAMLENLVEERQIKVVPSTSSSSSDAVASASEKL